MANRKIIAKLAAGEEICGGDGPGTILVVEHSPLTANDFYTVYIHSGVLPNEKNFEPFSDKRQALLFAAGLFMQLAEEL